MIPLLALTVESLALVVLALLLLVCRREIRELRLRVTERAPASHPASRLVPGDPLRTDLGATVPGHLFLLVTHHGCPKCDGVAEQFEQVGLPEPWRMLAVIGGTSRSLEDSPPQIPSYASIVPDPQRRVIRELGVTQFPSALVFVNGRLVDQVSMPTRDWFQDLLRRRATAREIYCADCAWRAFLQR